MCTFKTSPCMPTHLAHTCFNVHAGAFWTFTRCFFFFLDGHTGCMEKGWGSSSASRFLPRKQLFLIMFMSILTGCWVHLLSPIFLLAMNGPRTVITCFRGSPKETLGSFAFSSLRISREHHVPDSSNHSPSLIKLFNSRHMTKRHKKEDEREERSEQTWLMVSPVVCSRSPL